MEIRVRLVLPLLLLAAAVVARTSALPNATRTEAATRKNPLLAMVTAGLEAKRAALIEKHGDLGSKALEQATVRTRAIQTPGQVRGANRTALEQSEPNFPFAARRASLPPPTVRARSLISYDDVMFKWVDASSDCKKTLRDIGWDNIQLAELDKVGDYDDDDLDYAGLILPEESPAKGCELFYNWAIEEAYKGYGRNNRIPRDFCDSCTDTTWLKEFGSTCGVDLVKHYWGRAKKMPQDTEGSSDPKRIAEHAFGIMLAQKSMTAVLSIGVIDYFGAAAKVACFLSGEGKPCAEGTSTRSPEAWWDTIEHYLDVTDDDYVDYGSDTDDSDNCRYWPDRSTDFIWPECYDFSCPSSWEYGSSYRLDPSDCCYTSAELLEKAQGWISYCPSVPFIREVSEFTDLSWPTCTLDFWEYQCKNTAKYLNDYETKYVECCGPAPPPPNYYTPTYYSGSAPTYYYGSPTYSSGSGVVAACSKKGQTTGDAIADYFTNEIGDRSLSYTSNSSPTRSPWTSTPLAVVALGLMTVCAFATGLV